MQKKITLQQFLSYMNNEEIFQVSLYDDEWENYTEFLKKSRLLIPYMSCQIDSMGAVFDSKGKEPVIRISIRDTDVKYPGGLSNDQD